VLYISPFHFTFTDSVKFLLINIIGGSGSILGPLVGAALITPLPELLQNYLVWQQVLYGTILILAMRFAPEGVVPLVARGLRKWIDRS
jgi:branched-chain amino acid transport system ATP-binding protein/branched-chain amino acid transport system permease protein